MGGRKLVLCLECPLMPPIFPKNTSVRAPFRREQSERRNPNQQAIMLGNLLDHYLEL